MKPTLDQDTSPSSNTTPISSLQKDKLRKRNSQGSQTLARGIEILELIAEVPGGLTVPEIAARMSLDRAIISRLIKTLEERGYVKRDLGRRFRLGSRVLQLARSVKYDLRDAAGPILGDLADALGASVILLIRDGDEAVVIEVVEPTQVSLDLSFRLGSRHPLAIGAEGMAILVGGPPLRNERPEITAGRTAGYVVSAGEVHEGTWGLAAPINVGTSVAQASIGVISIRPLPEHDTAALVMDAAKRIGVAMI